MPGYLVEPAPQAAIEHPVTIGRYLLDRLAATGIRYVFGLPGDYNLALLDAIEAHPELEWVGNANELNASYMADGYARIAGCAAIVTTNGVGELSAMNGIAGAYAEHVPTVHIVGTPTMQTQTQKLPVHHSLLDGDHGHFLRVHGEVTCASSSLSAANAAAEIDRVLNTVLTQKRPGYIALPADLVNVPCLKPEPATSRPSVRTALAPDAAARSFAESAASLLTNARRIVVLVDHLAQRYGVGGQLDQLIRKAGLTAVVTPTGKGTINESAEGFAGMYAGSIGEPQARAAVESADVVIGVGLVAADLNTGGFTAILDTAKLIELQPYHSVLGAVRIDNLTMPQALDEIAALLSTRTHTIEHPVPAATDTREDDPDAPLDQERFWHRFSGFLRAGDILAADQGTALYGVYGVRLPAGVTIISQPLWASIGYSLPAIAGAQLASTPRRRAVLVIGDGSAQLTIQEIGTMRYWGLDPIIVVLNNDGYAVERAINGWTAAYNDITRWNWQQIPGAFGVENGLVTRATSVGELEAALTRAEQEHGQVRFIEVILGRHDLPHVLSETVKGVSERNKGVENG